MLPTSTNILIATVLSVSTYIELLIEVLDDKVWHEVPTILKFLRPFLTAFFTNVNSVNSMGS